VSELGPADKMAPPAPPLRQSPDVNQKPWCLATMEDGHTCAFLRGHVGGCWHPSDAQDSDKLLATDPLAAGVKFDGEKARYDLLVPLALDQIAQVSAYGAKKYAERNFEKGMSWGRVFAAAMRHLWAFWRGEFLDPESKLPHLAHAAWNVMALMLYSSGGYTQFDDRSRGPSAP